MVEVVTRKGRCIMAVEIHPLNQCVPARSPPPDSDNAIRVQSGDWATNHHLSVVEGWTARLSHYGVCRDLGGTRHSRPERSARAAAVPGVVG